MKLQISSQLVLSVGKYCHLLQRAQTVDWKYSIPNMNPVFLFPYQCVDRLVLEFTWFPWKERDQIKNIARIANAVQCHNQLSGNKDCHEFRFSIVRIVISVSNVTSLQDCLFNCQNGKSNCLNCENCRQLSKIVKAVWTAKNT